MAFPRDVVAGDAVATAGSTLVMMIETVGYETTVYFFKGRKIKLCYP